MMIAPIMPFLAEEVYASRHKVSELSVFSNKWTPDVSTDMIWLRIVPLGRFRGQS
jgi:isoleucyl-tRNA synthetase